MSGVNLELFVCKDRFMSHVNVKLLVCEGTLMSRCKCRTTRV